MMYFILTFFLGASVGSFVNVLIDRTMTNEDWVRGRSHCDHCKKTLAWYDMIPVVSYLVYRGKSRCCARSLSFRYPIVEIMVGLLFTWWLGVGFVFFQLVNAPLSVIQPLFWLLLGIILTILAVADLFYGVVIMPIVWIGMGLTMIYRLTLFYYGVFQSIDLVNSLLLAAAFFGFFWSLWKLTKGRGMAEGDMHVALLMGIIVGWPSGVVAMMASFVLGAVVGIILIVSKLKSRKESVPFVPFMTAGIVIALLWGDLIIGFLGW